MKKAIKKEIEIPEGIEVKIELPKAIVTGSLGSIEKIFKFQKEIGLKKEDNLIIIGCPKATKKEKKMINTLTAHFKNMFKGVTEGFEYRMQVCSIHFPITVNIDKEKNLLLIKNFLGETKERTAKLLSNIDVSIQGDKIIIKGIDIEKVSQCAANIERATKIKARDRRVYQDGIFMISKAGREL